MKQSHVMRKALLVGVAAAFVIYVVATLAVASTTGIISGVVSDAAKGTKLSGVNIEVRGLNLTTVTDENGYFVITNVPPGSYEVVATMVGYKDGAKSELAVMMDSTSSVNIALEESVAQEKEATVSAARSLVHPDVAPSLYVVSAKQEEMTRSQPNALYQVPGIVVTTPGVTVDADGYPHIRGGRSQHVGYMLEGIPVTESTTNGFGTNLVTLGMSKMQIYTGGYRAEYGNSISGVFNEIKKTGREVRGGNIESLYGSQEYMGQIAEMGDVTSGGLDYYVGAYLWHTNFERQYFAIADVADTLGKFVYPVSKDDKLTLLVNNGTAKYQLHSSHTLTDLAQPVPLERDHGHQGFEIYSLTWAHNFSPSSFLTVRPYLFHNWYTVDGVSEPWPPTLGYGFYNDVSCSQRGLQLEYTNQTSPTHLVKTGISAIKADNRYRGYSPFMGPTEYDYTSAVDTLQTSVFAQDQIKLGNKVQLELGARYDAMKFDKTVADDESFRNFNPRMGLTFNPSEKNVWRLSWGKYTMFPPTYMMDRVYTDPSWEDYRISDSPVRPEHSESIDFGFERQVSDNILFRVTPFYRSYRNLHVADRLFPGGPREYISEGRGTTKGIEMLTQKKLSDNWEGWLSYTWMRARGHASAAVNYDPALQTYLDWDQRNTISGNLLFHKGKWHHNVQLQYNSGLPYASGEIPYANDLRMSGYSVVSYGVTRDLPKGSKIGDAIRLDVYNIFNSAEVTHIVGGEPSTWVAPRFINLSVSKKF